MKTKQNKKNPKTFDSKLCIATNCYKLHTFKRLIKTAAMLIFI